MDFEVLGILFMVIVAPTWLFLHYGTAWRKTKSISNADENLLEELWHLSQKIEERVETLEVILDKDNDEWRK